MGGEKNLHGRHGIALVAVLWVLVLLSVMAAGLLRETSVETRLARNLIASTQARALADAGVYRAILSLRNPKQVLKFGAETEKLLKDRAGIREALLSRSEIQEALKGRADLQAADLESAVDADVWRPDGTIYVWPFGDGIVLISIQDEAGKVDLNNATDDLLEGLFVAVGVENEQAVELVHAIGDFRDEDDISRSAGAEDDDYRAAGYAWEAKDAPFETVAELEQVIGMTREIYERVAPFLTVNARRRGRIDPMTAPAEVLRAIPGADAGQIDSLLEARTQSDGGTAGNLPALTGVKSYIGRSRGQVFTIRAEVLAESGASFVREAIVQLTPSQSQPFRVHAWRQGTSMSASYVGAE